MDEATPGARARPDASTIALLASAFVVATCGLVYELLAGTLASYLLGDSVTQFSTVIGSYLFAMGMGSWVSRYVREGELRLFVRVEILIALIGGWSAAGLFMLFPVIDHFRVALYALVLAIGFLVGLEIPLLMRVLRPRFAFREVVSTVLTFDYVGALAASLLFPLVAIARNADVTPSSIYRWRRQLCGSAPKRPKGFTAVAIRPDPGGGGDVVREMMVIEIGGATVRVPNTASPALLVAALGELRR